jgi:hypothetical protein
MELYHHFPSIFGVWDLIKHNNFDFLYVGEKKSYKVLAGKLEENRPV